MSRKQGLTEEKLRALGDYEGASVFDACELAVLRYSDAMTATPVKVPQAVFDALREHFDDPQIVELTSAIAWENYRARFDHAMGIEAEGFSDGEYCPLPAGSHSQT